MLIYLRHFARAVLPLLCCFLSAPAIRSAPAAAPPPALRDALERARMLADKIAKEAEGSTLDFSQPTGDLQMMAAALRIPPAPVLKPLSEHFDTDTCLERTAEGVRMFQDLLEVLSERLGGLDGLRADLRDLLAQIAKVREAARPGGAEPGRDRRPGMAAQLHGDFEAQTAARLTLAQLRSFAHDVIRSLRAIATRWTPAR
ncbi:uncharacterized protein LOC133514061 isoform X2 [Syngnathoides biaculeatus]|uniref:uncharacterized protein LOC133514061 isoform X2 n=1 Tax=Syngnathoides biaculeatus TaxID=300417 RepID=UPI002ADE0093|nr:uncharacterized protein LOC133514061 isoform X2 [Syngnathoides biaculeatus]